METIIDLNVIIVNRPPKDGDTLICIDKKNKQYGLMYTIHDTTLDDRNNYRFKYWRVLFEKM